MRAGDPVPSPRYPHHGEARRVDGIGVVALGHESEPPEEELAHVDYPRGRLELDARVDLRAEELGGREGSGEDGLGVRREDA